MISVILNYLGTGGTALVGFISGLFSDVIGLIYVTTPAPALTTFGQILFFGAIISAFFFVLRWITNLVRIRMGR